MTSRLSFYLIFGRPTNFQNLISFVKQPVNGSDRFIPFEVCFQFNRGTCCRNVCLRNVIFPENQLRWTMICEAIKGVALECRVRALQTHGGSLWKEIDTLSLIPAALCVSESVWLHRRRICNREDGLWSMCALEINLAKSQ